MGRRGQWKEGKRGKERAIKWRVSEGKERAIKWSESEGKERAIKGWESEGKGNERGRERGEERGEERKEGIKRKFMVSEFKLFQFKIVNPSYIQCKDSRNCLEH